MVATRRSKETSTPSTPSPLSSSTVLVDSQTDLELWRLKDENGRHTWHYLTETQAKSWPQTIYDRHHLGLPVSHLLPKYAKPSRPLDAAKNAIAHFTNFQLPAGHWACEYGGPLFLLPGLVVTWYVTETEVPEAFKTEIPRYLFARQNDDGGWGLHIEGHSSVFGTAMNYVCCRLLGVQATDERLLRAREKLMSLGGATAGPHWAKFWLSVLGITPWEVVNPVPPELWLLPDWIPFAPWRWWIHMRMVFLPMGYIYSKRFSYPLTPLTRSLQSELFTTSVEKIDFPSHRNTIAPEDYYNPHSWLLNLLNWILVVIYLPFLRLPWLKKRGEDYVYEQIKMEDSNTKFANLGPVNHPMNLLARYIGDGPDSEAVARHRERNYDFLWMKNEGMLMNGTNGVQVWDTAFFIQAVVESDLASEPEYKESLTNALRFLANHQIPEDVPHREKCYRQRRNGAWPFSTQDQGYTVSDCTAEALKSVLLLQRETKGFPTLVSNEKVHDAIDTLLTMQNASGGFASYEEIRGSTHLELLNAAEVFGRIMIEYDYPECTTAVVTALSLFTHLEPTYRAEEIASVKKEALRYIRDSQRVDGSWYGSWGICFTYATMFALESLASVGETYGNSERVRRACAFLVAHQRGDGGWGESYKSCEISEWVDHKDTQVVQTCWALLGLMVCGFEDLSVLRRGIQLVMRRQDENGGWKQEAIEGVFNKSCMISYPNYKFIFPIKALGMFAKLYPNEMF